MKLAQYRKYFSPRAFVRRLGRLATQTGTKAVYSALLLYYAYERKETPAWAKKVVVGALGYLILPVDLIPDLTPVVGLTDDVAVIGASLVTIAAYVNQDVRDRARQRLREWIPEPEAVDLAAVEERLSE